MCLQGLNPAGKDSQVGRDGVRRKDWHDYQAIKRDSSRSGRSAVMRPVVVLQCKPVRHMALRCHSLHTAFISVISRLHIVPSREQLPQKQSLEAESHPAQLLTLVGKVPYFCLMEHENDGACFCAVDFLGSQCEAVKL